MCQEIIKSRLKTPATYSAAKISPYKDQISEREYSSYLEDKEDKTTLPLLIDRLHGSNDHPIYIKVFVEYDAQNSFGALIRNIAKCEYVGTENTASPTEYNVYMDGQTKTGYVLEDLDALAGTTTKRKKTMDDVRRELGINSF